MTQIEAKRHAQIQTFIQEMIGFSDTAEKTLTEIETDLLEKKNLFSVFTQRMVAIRGTSLQLGLPEIAHIAELGEEISIKATHSDTRAALRKCVGSLWDAQGTIKYLLEHYTEQTTEEQDILVNRLQKTLKSLGGARPSLGSDDIEALIKEHND
ncbi:MAG: hypothetical protein ABIQ95_07075 [Bdellovibrionia bacterium]